MQDVELFKQANFIDDQWAQADDNAVIDVFNPANGEKLGVIPKCGRTETARAIDAAHRAFQSWRKTTAAERSALHLIVVASLVPDRNRIQMPLPFHPGSGLMLQRYGFFAVPTHGDCRSTGLELPIPTI